jgi:hypothetical protein
MRDPKRLVTILEPVRNGAVVCFEWVTANSVCDAVPVRNRGAQTEPFAKNALGKPVRNVRTGIAA